MTKYRHFLTNGPGSKLMATILCAALILPLLLIAKPANALPIPTFLAAPSNLDATTVGSEKQIDLSWQDNTNNEVNYSIERKVEGEAYEVIAEVDADTDSFSDTSVSYTTTYTYRVRAIGNGSNIKNSPYSNEASATTASLISIPVFLKAPSDLTATAVSGKKQINLSWSDNTNNETAYSIERKSGDGSYAVIAQLPVDSQQYADTTVLFNSTYTYQVQALGNGQKIKNSPYSNEATATTDKLIIVPELPLKPPILPALKTVLKFYIGSTDYYVNDKLETMDASPVINQGRTVLPIKYVATPLGAAVDWNAIERKVTITLGSKTIELWIDRNTAKINGQETLIDPNNTSVTPVILSSGRTMLPLRFIAESLGSSVDWNQLTQEAKITYPE